MTDPNFVKIGDEYFASEWFDFDREEKTAMFMHFYFRDEDEPETEAPAADERKFGEGCCPNCGDVHASWLGRYKNKDGVWRSDYKCDTCGQIFAEDDEGIP